VLAILFSSFLSFDFFACVLLFFSSFVLLVHLFSEKGFQFFFATKKQKQKKLTKRVLFKNKQQTSKKKECHVESAHYVASPVIV
jgi:hypothetical protein